MINSSINEKYLRAEIEEYDNLTVQLKRIYEAKGLRDAIYA